MAIVLLKFSDLRDPQADDFHFFLIQKYVIKFSWGSDQEFLREVAN